MANPELGAKQICPTCSTKFYDLTRRPALCPKCGAEFDPEEALRNRRVRARPLVADDEVDQEKPPVTADNEDGFEAEADDAPELDQVSDEPPIMSDDDDAEEPDAAAGPASESLGVDFSEDDDLEAGDDDEVPFIEDEDDDFPEDEIDGLAPEGTPDDH